MVPADASRPHPVLPVPFSFEQVDAEDYERLRPGYPQAAVRWAVERAGMGPGDHAVDLGAGTGQLARHLVAGGLTVTAVEPAANMRVTLARTVPAARALAGFAESIPLRDGTADIVASGQAFHHFQTDDALGEIHRVLRPGGKLALFWVLPEADDPVDRGIDGVLERYQADVWRPFFAGQRWREWFDRTDLFEATARRTFDHALPVDPLDISRAMRTSSDVASLPEEVRVPLLEDLDRFAATIPRPASIRFVVDVELWRRR